MSLVDPAGRIRIIIVGAVYVSDPLPDVIDAIILAGVAPIDLITPCVSTAIVFQVKIHRVVTVGRRESEKRRRDRKFVVLPKGSLISCQRRPVRLEACD